MGTTGADEIERTAASLLAPLCAASGAVVLAGFFFPSFVGSAVSGTWWLLVSLIFFGSGLCYLALLPYDSVSSARTGESRLLGIRRAGVRNLLSEFAGRQDPAVVGLPVLVFACYLGLQVAAPAATTAAVEAAADWVLSSLGPVFLVTVFAAVCYCLFLLVGPWGDVTLGDPDAEPAYTYPTYFSLVFTGGIAAGVVFWGPAEALFHYRGPPPYFGATPESADAIGGALTYALFHWGLSAWSAYAVVGVPVAYFVFNRDAPLRVSTILAPFVGVDGLDSRWSTAVDTLAVFATVGGVATSVALVSRQFLAGIGYQWGVSTGASGAALFVAGLTLIYVVSCETGVHRGIRRIAGLNVVLFGLFALLIAGVGPRPFVVERGVDAVGRYVGHFVGLSLYAGDPWVSDWTVWNWLWWFSWAPFAGLFLAALSRGRRVRTVVFTSVVATAAATATWFLLLGGTSLYVQHTGRADVLGAIAARGGSEAVAGFPLFDALPLSRLLMFLFLALIVVFMVTSADTSTLVVAMLTARRGLAPSTGSVVFWGVFQGAVAVSVLALGGGETLQALAVLTGGPFAVLSVVALVGLTLTFLRHERGRGHTSLPARLWRRLPTIQAHHDVDPPEED